MSPYRIPVARPVATSMVFLAIVILGIIGWVRIPVELIPSLSGDSLVVQFFRPGSEPEVVERELLLPMAAAASRLDGVQESWGSVSGSSGELRVRFLPGVDLDVRELELRRSASELVREQPFGTTVNVGDQGLSAFNRFAMMVQVAGMDDENALFDFVEESIRPRLSAVPGVSQVLPTGGAGRELTVRVDPDLTAAAGVDLREVTGRLASAVRRLEYLGSARDGDGRTSVVLDGRPRGIESLGELRVASDRPVRLRHVATVEFGSGRRETLFRANGNPAVGMIIVKEEGANLVHMGRALRERMDEIEAEFADFDISFIRTFDAAEAVEEQLDRIEQLALTGFAIALAVLFLFLRQWRAVAVVAIAVPVSLLAAVAMMYLGGLTINIVTLFGLAVGIGMLVDNSIVVYEAVQRALEQGASPDDAAERGVARTARAIFASSATNAIVFVPLAFAVIEDVTLRTLVQLLALAITIPLAASLIVAVGLVPLLARRLAAPAAARRIARQRDRRARFAGMSPPDRAREVFSGMLKVALRRPGGWVGSVVVAVFGTVAIALPLVLVQTIGKEAREANPIMLAVTLPTGGSLDAAGEVFGRLEAAALDVEGVESVESFVQETGGSLNVRLVDLEERPGVGAEDVRVAVRDAAAEIDPAIDVQSPNTSSGGGSGGGADQRGSSGLPGQSATEIVVSGPDYQQLNALARDLARLLESIPEIDNARVSARGGNPEYWVLTSDVALEAFGLTPDQVLPILRTVRRDGVEMQVGFTLPNGREIPLRVRSVETSGAVRRDLGQLTIPIEDAALPLAAVSDVRRMPGRAEIQHHDGRREVSVFYALSADAPDTGAARTDLERRISETVAAVHRPAGYTIETPAADEGFGWFRKILLPAVLLLFGLLAITFESLTLPILVLVALPLTVLGSTWALALSGTPAEPMALAGALALIGITVNPAILLVDRMQQRVRLGGRSPGAAALAAVRERTRPVLMTAATTIAGMWPLAISTGRENELWPPFATVVMGGLLTSAVLTLLMIPVGFTVLVKLDRLFGRLGPWFFLGWVAVTTAIMTPLILGNAITSTTWQIVTTVLIASGLLGALAWLVPKPLPPQPDTSEGPPVVETRTLTKTYGEPGPIGRAWRVGDRFVARVVERGGAAFDPGDARSRIAVFVLLLAGALYLASTVELRLWRIVYAFVAAAFARRALLEVRRARGLVDGLGRVAPGGLEGWIGVALPWVALAWLVRGIAVDGRGGLPTTAGWVLIAILVVGTAVITTGRRIATKIASGRIDVQATGRLPRLRTAVRRISRRVFGLDLPREEVRALRGVDFRAEGGMIGILGPNGAGKTTFLRLVAGILDPSIGTVWLGRAPLEGVRRHLARWVGYLPQEFGLPNDLTAREYLDYYALLYDIPQRERNERVEHLLTEVGLADRANDKIGGYSGGMRQRVAVARTLLRLPPVIIVDEPTVGLDPRERIRFRNLLSRLSRGRIVLFSTHVVEDVAVACPRVVVMARGRLVFDGAPERLADVARGRVWEARLLAEERDALDASARIVDEVPEAGGVVRVRVVGHAAPHPSAVPVDPTLEDGYLSLVGGARRV